MSATATGGSASGGQVYSGFGGSGGAGASATGSSDTKSSAPAVVINIGQVYGLGIVAASLLAGFTILL